MAEKGKLSARGEALLQDMARDHGLRGLEFDKDGLIPIQVGGIQIAIAYSGANDSFFMITVRVPENRVVPVAYEKCEEIGRVLVG